MTRITIVAVLLIGLLSGCATPPESPDQVEQTLEQIEALRETNAIDPAPGPQLRQVRIPRAEAWLDGRLTARYDRLPADEAVKLVVQDRPVRFNFATSSEAPLVRWPPGARTLRDHLDSITAQADWSYEVLPGVVQVHDIETRYFVLSAQPGATQSTLGLRNLEDAGGSTADNRVELSLDPYTKEIVDAVEGVLGIGDERTSVTIAPSANLLIVTARPNAMRHVERVMSMYNDSVSSIVRISLSIIEVEVEDEETHELLLNLIRRSASVPLSLVLGATGGGQVGGTVGSVLPGTAPVAGESRYAGSTAVYNWLSTFGNTTLNFDDTVEVLNNHVASVDVTRTEPYIREIKSSVNEGVTTQEVTFEDLRTGLVVHLQPTVVDGHITLRIGLSRSAEVGRTNFDEFDIKASLPVTDNFNRVLSVSLVDGEPKLLSSFSQSATRDKRSQIPFLGPLGSGKDSAVRRRETVMLLTANLINSRGVQ